MSSTDEKQIVCLEAYYNIEDALKFVEDNKKIQRSYMRRHELQQASDKLNDSLRLLSLLV